MGAFYFTRDEDVSEKPEVLDIVLATGRSVAEVVFHLEEFWRRVNQRGESLIDGSGNGVMRGYRLKHLPLLVGLDDEYWTAVAKCGWVKESPIGLIIPGFDERFGKLAQKRMAATARQQRSRANRDDFSASSAEAVEPPRRAAVAGNGVQDHVSNCGPSVEAGSFPHIVSAGDSVGRGGSSDISGIDQAPVVSEGNLPDSDLSGETRVQADRVDTVAARIEPRRPNKRQQASQFDLLNVADLSVCGKLLAWIEQIAPMRRPVVIADEWHRLRVVAAGVHVTGGKGVKSPMALFKSIVGKRRWTMLEPEDIKAAEAKLRNYRADVNAIRQAKHDQFKQRVQEVPLAGLLVGAGFGAIPPPATKNMDAIRERALKWERDRKAKTG